MRAAKLNFASARALPGQTKQEEFDVESERQGRPQLEGPAEVGHEGRRAAQPAARREDSEEGREERESLVRHVAAGKPAAAYEAVDVLR